ncbi:MAG: hypothetical protein LBJ67_06415 [Planctomycetaceae bacterium]|nr:hypothetical protein [Planctomycetaceae bacterium]
MSFFINSLIRTFLAQEAYRFVEQEVTAQINRELHARQDAAAIHANSGEVDFAIIFSQPHEAVGLLDRYPNATATCGNGNTFYTFLQESKRIVAAVPTGVSREHFENITNAVIDVFHPRRVVTAGFAAGISPGAALFSLYVPDVLIDVTTRQTIDLRQILLPAPLAEELSADCITSDKPTSETRENFSSAKKTTEKTTEKTTADETWFRTATLATVRRLYLSVSQKKDIRSAFAAHIADYSAFSVADICRKRWTPALPLRIVTSVYNEELPRETKQISGKVHNARRLGAFLGNFVRRPGSVIDVVKQKQRQLEAADILATKIIRLIRQGTSRTDSFNCH